MVAKAKKPDKKEQPAITGRPELIEYQIDNWMRVRTSCVRLNGKSAIVLGENGSGKTSWLDGLYVLIKGRSANAIPEPVHKGADKAVLRGNFGAFTVERTFLPDGKTELLLTAADGNTFRRPQEVLDGFLGNLSPLDPVAFLGLRPQDQLDQVLRIAGVKPPVDEVEKIAGERHEPVEGDTANSYLMRLSANETGTYYLARRQANREVEQKTHALEEQQEALAKLGGPLQADERAESASEVLAEIDRLSKLADQRRDLQAKARDAAQKVNEAKSLLEDIDAERAREEVACGEIERQIEAMQRQLVEKRAAIDGLTNRLSTGAGIVKGFEVDAQQAWKAAQDFADQSPAIAERRQQLATLEDRNKTLGRRRLAQEQADSIARDLEKARAEHQSWDSVLEQLRHLRAHMLDGVDLAIKGLEVGDGELRLNGVSFKQASRAESIRIACAIAMAAQPQFPILRVDNGEALDSKSKDLLFEVAHERGFQLLMGKVADGEQLKVQIVEG